MSDIEGDLYIIHEREEATEEEYAKADKVLNTWIEEGIEI